MICKECATAAKINKQPDAYIGTDRKPVLHPDNCGCPCQHKPVGSWKGMK